MCRKTRTDPFEQYGLLPKSYHDDLRWQQVVQLREQGKHAEANGLVFRLRDDYGFEG